MFSSDGGRTFGGKFISHETSTEPPALASSGGRLFVARKGDGNDNLNIAEVAFCKFRRRFRDRGADKQSDGGRHQPRSAGIGRVVNVTSAIGQLSEMGGGASG
jgi:hypothetical protein